MATTSAFFPNAARPKRGRPERTPPPSTAAAAFTPSTQYAPSRAAGARGSPQVPSTLAWSAEVRPQWESIRVVLPENSSSSPCAQPAGAHEPLRFPSVRTTLWDRAPLGPASSLRPVTPRIALPAALLQRLAEHALAGASGDGHSPDGVLRLEPDQASRQWSARSAAAEAMLRPLSLRACALAPCDAAGRAVLGSTIAASAPMHAPGASLPGVTDAPVRCRGWPANGELVASTADYAELIDRLDASLDGSVPLSLPETVSAHALAACSPDRSRLLVRIEAVVPGLHVEAVPLYPLRVLPSALAESLLPAAGRRTARTGYLTLEQSRKLVLLGERDPKASEVLLVGIWVSGVPSVTSPYVWAAATRFARLTPPAAHTVKTQDGVAAFLCVLYPSAPHSAVSPGGLVSAAAHAPTPAMFEMQPQSEPCSTLRLAGATMQVRLPPPSPSAGSDDAVLFETSAVEAPPFSRLIAQRYPSAPHANAAAAAAAAALTASCMRKLSASAPPPQRASAASARPSASPPPPPSAAASMYSSPLPQHVTPPTHPLAHDTHLSFPPAPRLSQPRRPPPAAPAEDTAVAVHCPRSAAESVSTQPAGGVLAGLTATAVVSKDGGSAGDSDPLLLDSPLVSLVVELQRQLASLSSRVEQQGREAARMSQHISALQGALAESEAARAAAAVQAAVAAPSTQGAEAGRTSPSEVSRRGAEAPRGGDALLGSEAASGRPELSVSHSAAREGEEGYEGCSAHASQGYNSVDEGSDGEGDAAAFWGDDVYDEIPRIEYVPDEDVSDDDEDEEDEEEEKRRLLFGVLKEGGAGGEGKFECSGSDDDDEDEARTD